MSGAGFENDLLYCSNADFTNSAHPTAANGILLDNEVWLGRTAGVAGLSQIDVMTLTAGTGISLTRAGAGVPGVPGTLTIANTGSMTDLHTARFIVSAGGAPDGANFTTIAAAITLAVGATGNQTVFIQPGTYTENLTLPANINLSAYSCDPDTPNVSIVGTISCNDAGSRSISGIRLTTNSAAVLALSGTVATVVNLIGCYLNLTNNTGITSTITASVNSQVNLFQTNGNLGTTGIAYFTLGTLTNLSIHDGFYDNSAQSITASTFGAASIYFNGVQFRSVMSTASAANIYFHNSSINFSALTGHVNAIAVTLTNGGAGLVASYNSVIAGGTSSAISIGTGCNGYLYETSIFSNNTNAITGTGTLLSANLSFSGSSSTINSTLTQLLSISSNVQKVNVQTFVASGTYTPSVGLKYCTIEVVGGGGAGGGANITSSTQGAAGSGGGGGGYARKTISSATVGVSQTVTIGAGGTIGAAGAGGNTGGTTSVGAIVSASGGLGGLAGTVSGATTFAFRAGGAGGAGSSGDFNITGSSGGNSIAAGTNSTLALPGDGGASYFAGRIAAIGAATNSTNTGNPGILYGGGGSGGYNLLAEAAATTGSAGGAGIVVITEFI